MQPTAARIKRFLEIWTSGIYAHDQILAEPEPIFAAHRLDLDPDDARKIAQLPIVRGRAATLHERPPWMDDFRCYIDEKFAWRELIRSECAPSDERFRAWRERQVRRCDIELGPEQNRQIVHTPLAFELTHGCSVGCWFCALDAPKLNAVFTRSDENAALWRGVLEAVRDVIGPAAKWGSSYWATDPFDNDDYELLCQDFHEILGMYPQTTTSLALKSPDRVRALLRDSFAKGCTVNRFSVHTPAQLKRIHQTFTAEELAWTELILQNKESDSIKARAGKLLHFDEDRPDLAAHEREKLVAMLRERNPEVAQMARRVVVKTPAESCIAPDDGEEREGVSVFINISGTTSCVSGFLISMVDRTVKLISPCTANERWPLGYIVYDEGTFANADELRASMSGMIDRNMPARVSPETIVRFTPRFSYVDRPDGFNLGTSYSVLQCVDENSAPYLRHLGDRIRDGHSRAGEIAVECFYRFGFPELITLSTINNFFLNGMISEERTDA